MDERLVEVTPLYAGETAGRIGSIVPAAQAVRELAGAQLGERASHTLPSVGCRSKAWMAIGCAGASRARGVGGVGAVRVRAVSGWRYGPAVRASETDRETAAPALSDEALQETAHETPGASGTSLGAVRAIAFVVGAASLGAEIAAARLLAPYFGASTIIWANTIATVLVALSIGYAVGGRLADRVADRERHQDSRDRVGPDDRRSTEVRREQPRRGDLRTQARGPDDERDRADRSERGAGRSRRFVRGLLQGFVRERRSCSLAIGLTRAHRWTVAPTGDRPHAV